MSDLEPREIGGVIIGAGLAIAGAWAAFVKWWKPDYVAMANAVAEAVASKYELQNTQHRNALIQSNVRLAEQFGRLENAITSGFSESNRNTLSVNTATTANIGKALELYGKDVTEIRSAQSRMDTKADELAKEVAVLIDRSKRNGN